MKLKQLFETNPADEFIWNDEEDVAIQMQNFHKFVNNLSYEQQKEMLKDDGALIMNLDDPSEELQLLAVKQNPDNIDFFYTHSELVIKTVLTDPRFIKNEENYNRQVQEIFQNNSLLMKKWIRYGKTMRNLG